jgi:hypothetical protein
MAMSRDKFVGQLIKRRLMTAEEIRSFERKLPPEKLLIKDAALFLQELVEQQKITACDAAAIYHRREQGLFGKPQKIRIVPDEFYFQNVGRLDDGTQFMAFCTGALPDGSDLTLGNDALRTVRRWIAVLHQFDAEGNHRRSVSRLGALDTVDWERACEKAEFQLQALLAPLEQLHPRKCEVSLRLFSVVLDGVTHGLVYEHYVGDDDEGEWVALRPRDVVLEPPWNSGEYSS